MSGVSGALGGLVVLLLAEWGYIAAFRAAFEAQTETVRRRPWASFAVGLGAAAVWTAVGRAALAAGGTPFRERLFTVPLFLAAAAGGAVCLGAAAAAVLSLDVTERPYLCAAVGGAAAGALGLVPRLGIFVMTGYACAGAGAILLSEFSGRRRARFAARLGLPGLACLLGLTVVLGLALSRLR